MWNIKERNKGWLFRLENQIVMILSKEFPLAVKTKRLIQGFTHGNTKRVTDQAVVDVFNSIPFETGKCFHNAANLFYALMQNGIKGWDYYSGWFFAGEELPVFSHLGCQGK